MNSTISTKTILDLRYTALDEIFSYMSFEDFPGCAKVCKAWVQVAINGYHKVARLFEIKAKLTPSLIESLGGWKAIRNFPYLNIKDVREFTNGIIKLNEIHNPITIGRVSCQTKDPKIIIKTLFIAFRFINRQTDPEGQKSQLNIMLTTGYSWHYLKGNLTECIPIYTYSNGGQESILNQTTQYIRRLVLRKNCGFYDLDMALEKTMPNGLSIISLV